MNTVIRRSFGRLFFFAPLFGALVILANCAGGGSKVSSSGSLLPQNPVGFRILLDQGTPSLAPSTILLGAQVEITYAEMNVRRVKFLLPPGYTCVKYETEVEKEAKEREEAKQREEESHCEHCQKMMTPQHETSSPTTLPTATKFRHSDQCELDHEGPAAIHFNGPFRVDLLSGSSNPPLENLAVPVGTYKRVDLRVDDYKDSPTDPLYGYSLLLYGRYTSGTTTITFRFALEFNEDIRFESPTGITIGTEGGKDFLLQFPVSTWLGRADLTSCFQNLPSGTTFLNIDDQSDNEPSDACKIEKILKDSFKNSYRFKRED
jgi:hypothetical protein